MNAAENCAAAFRAADHRGDSFPEVVVRRHPYGTILATEDDAKKLTLQDVKEYYEANFGAQRSHIYVAGKFDVAAVKKAIAETFGNWAKGPAKLENVPSPKPKSRAGSDRPARCPAIHAGRWPAGRTARQP